MTMMKRTARALKFFAVLLFSFLFLISSCSNIFEEAVNESSHDSQTEIAAEDFDDPAEPAAPAAPRYAFFNGSLSVNGAIPAQMEQALADPDNTTVDVTQNAADGANASVQNTSTQNRTALPSLPTGTGYYYFVRAEDNSVPTHVIHDSIATLDDETGRYVYNLQLELNKTWTFTAGFRKSSGNYGQFGYEEEILLIDYGTANGDSYSTPLNENSASLMHRAEFYTYANAEWKWKP